MASAAKITGIFILFSITFLIGLLPFALIRVFEKKLSKENVKKWIGILNCFTGGIFLGTAILHLLPEARELLTECISYDYHVAEAITGFGVLMTLTLEHLVMYYGIEKLHRMHDTGNGSKIEPKDDSTKNSNDTEKTEKETSIANNSEKSEDNVKVEEPNFKFLAFRSFLLLLALSFHMIFQGLLLGLQTDEDDAWILLGVYSLHNAALAFGVGFQLEENLRNFLFAILSLLTFSFVAPIGVVIGYIVTEGHGHAHGENKFGSGILESLSAGVFLYVAFFGILCHEIHTTKERSHWKILFTVIGFVIIVGTQFVKHDPYDHRSCK